MPMPSIGLLHLTDFHQGMGGQKTLWPNVKESFLDDLARLHERAGPWDAVLFTGDLTQRGRGTEFEAFDRALTSILERLQPLGSTPIVLAVPGNHDLQRPPPSEDLEALARWHETSATADSFFADRAATHRRLVDSAFSDYALWWERRVKANGQAIHAGELPGDFRATIEKDGLRLALVGLNSSFLQLRDKMREGELAVDLRQLLALHDDPPSWLREHHAALLLTHHPLAWLHPHAQAEFRSEIDRPGRFAAHLFGHMHEASARAVSEGASLPRRGLQGLSLFGLEAVNDHAGTRVQRLHGYAALRLSVNGSTGELAIWPRSYEPNRDAGYHRMVADHGRYDLQDEAARWQFPALRPLLTEPGPARPPTQTILEQTIETVSRRLLTARSDTTLRTLIDELDVAVERVPEAPPPTVAEAMSLRRRLSSAISTTPLGTAADLPPIAARRRQWILRLLLSASVLSIAVALAFVAKSVRHRSGATRLDAGAQPPADDAATAFVTDASTAPFDAPSPLDAPLVDAPPLDAPLDARGGCRLREFRANQEFLADTTITCENVVIHAGVTLRVSGGHRLTIDATQIEVRGSATIDGRGVDGPSGPSGKSIQGEWRSQGGDDYNAALSDCRSNASHFDRGGVGEKGGTGGPGATVVLKARPRGALEVLVDGGRGGAGGPGGSGRLLIRGDNATCNGCTMNCPPGPNGPQGDPGPPGRKVIP